MTYQNMDAPRATCWIIDGIVTHKGNDYPFWAEWEMVMNEVTYEFNDPMFGEPAGDFDFEQFERDCRAMLEDYAGFCEKHKFEQHYNLGEN